MAPLGCSLLGEGSAFVVREGFSRFELGPIGTVSCRLAGNLYDEYGAAHLRWGKIKKRGSLLNLPQRVTPSRGGQLPGRRVGHGSDLTNRGAIFRIARGQAYSLRGER